MRALGPVMAAARLSGPSRFALARARRVAAACGAVRTAAAVMA